jgi:hypothetical protein
MSISDESHLLPISDTHKSIEDFDSSDSDDDVEVVSNLDTQENELVDMSAYLRIGSSDESDDNNDDPFASTLVIGSTCSRSDSENEDHPIDTFGGAGDSVTVSSSLSLPPTLAVDDTAVANASGTPKCKRRQWSVVEKLKVLNAYESSNSKHRTAVEQGCITAQTRQWEKKRGELIILATIKKGKNPSSDPSN